MKKAKVSIFFSSFDRGGAEKIAVNLSKGLVINGVYVDILTANTLIPSFLSFLSSSIRFISLSCNSKVDLERKLIAYLEETKPWVLVFWKGFERLSADLIKRSKNYTKIIVRVGTTFTERDKNRNIIKRLFSKLVLKRNIKFIDKTIAVSKGVAEDIIKLTKVPKEKVYILPNPTIVPEIFDMAKEEIDHEWFRKKDFFKVLGVGGFRRSKDFPTLVKAFDIVRKKLSARLIILGDGRQRRKIESIIDKLNLKDYVWLPGFKENPYSFMEKSDVFVLSSKWEGCPNVLIESMALGTPVVSTDCPSGPREILCDGRYGILVPVGDKEKLADAIIKTLTNPLPEDVLKKAVKKYDYIESTKAYLKIFELY